jgi:hypothetical protein
MSEIANLGTLSIPEIKAVLATGVLTTKSFDYLEKKGWLRAFAQGLLGVALDGSVVWLPQDANGAKPTSDVVYGPNSALVLAKTHNWIPDGALGVVAAVTATPTALLTASEYGLLFPSTVAGNATGCWLTNANATHTSANAIGPLLFASGATYTSFQCIGPVKGPVYLDGVTNVHCCGVQKVLVV